MERAEHLFRGFSKLSRHERLNRLLEMGALTEDDLRHLNANQQLNPALAENFIENVIGYFQLPLGVATNFRIDGRDVVIPMAVEETSIVAAASKTARWVRENGTLTTSSDPNLLIGQIQFSRVSDFNAFASQVRDKALTLIARANKEPAAGLVRRGGGVRQIQVRCLDRSDGDTMAVVHVIVDTCDAMGANIVNQICEYLRKPLFDITGYWATMCILSNLSDTKLTSARICLKTDPETAERITEASVFAHTDPYRAATSNKGVMNGMDAVLIATGNDWRAVEAAAHAYAVRDGKYSSLTRWWREGEELIGELKAPIIVGTVGGVTRLHPTAQMALRMLNVQHANELARIVAAVGLVQNLGALQALTTVGIIEGHMKLHISNLTLGAGATEAEVPLLQKRLEDELYVRKRISLQTAKEILSDLREGVLRP